MRRLYLRLIVAALTFASGVATAYVPQVVGGLTVDEAEVPAPHMKFCEVHGAAMHLERVPVRRGPLSVTSISHLIAEERHYPHANRFVEEAFCERRSGQTALVYACPLCRVAQATHVEKYRRPIYGHRRCGIE